MLTIAICDDERAQLENTAALVRDHLQVRPGLTAKLFRFGGGEALLDAADEAGGFGLYIMDVIMPERNGIDTARKLHASFQEAVAPLLSDRRFLPCEASFVINLHHVAAVEKSEAVMDSGGRVPVSRAALAQVKKAWVDYWLEGGGPECCEQK